MHKLESFPLVLKDLRDITDYITEIFKAPNTAMDYGMPWIPSPCFYNTLILIRYTSQSIKDFENEYRLLPVKIYFVFLCCREKLVEICEAVAWFGVGRIEKQLI